MCLPRGPHVAWGALAWPLTGLVYITRSPIYCFDLGLDRGTKQSGDFFVLQFVPLESVHQLLSLPPSGLELATTDS